MRVEEMGVECCVLMDVAAAKSFSRIDLAVCVCVCIGLGVFVCHRIAGSKPNPGSFSLKDNFMNGGLFAVFGASCDLFRVFVLFFNSNEFFTICCCFCLQENFFFFFYV